MIRNILQRYLLLDIYWKEKTAWKILKRRGENIKKKNWCQDLKKECARSGKKKSYWEFESCPVCIRGTKTNKVCCVRWASLFGSVICYIMLVVWEWAGFDLLMHFFFYSVPLKGTSFFKLGRLIFFPWFRWDQRCSIFYTPLWNVPVTKRGKKGGMGGNDKKKESVSIDMEPCKVRNNELTVAHFIS